MADFQPVQEAIDAVVSAVENLAGRQSAEHDLLEALNEVATTALTPAQQGDVDFMNDLVARQEAAHQAWQAANMARREAETALTDAVRRLHEAVAEYVRNLTAQLARVGKN